MHRGIYPGVTRKRVRLLKLETRGFARASGERGASSDAELPFYRRPRPRPDPRVRVFGFALIDWHLGICDGDRRDRGAHEAALGVPERGDGVDAVRNGSKIEKKNTHRRHSWKRVVSVK